MKNDETKNILGKIIMYNLRNSDNFRVLCLKIQLKKTKTNNLLY